jgi:ankyrin repeat protein
MDVAWERAATHGDVEGVREMLAAGADVDARNRHGQTALILAAHRGHLKIVEALIEAGADLNVTAKYNLTGLMLAIVAGHVGVARLLALTGADLHVKGSGAPGFADKTAYDLAVDREMRELYSELQRP